MKNMSVTLAELLFPDVQTTIEDWRKKYPARPSGQQVARFAPSPTGFLHIGGVYTSYVAEKFVHQGGKNGVFYLRVEDTDQKREVEGGVAMILKGMTEFGLSVDEGPIGPKGSDVGAYGPYTQSQRKDIYRAFVKHLVAQGLAYPCWLTEEEIDSIRNMQQAAKKVPGVYGQYAKWRDASFEKQQEMISSGVPYVIRLRAQAELGDKVVVSDMIKGEVTTQDNFLDFVLLKSTDGLPTYHMAHLVDDYLMGTTHVIRADEWFASLPLHMQLFKAFGFDVPKYAHIAPLLKIDAETGNKRKLSKRHDPESSVMYFFEQGIPTDAILEFLTNIVDPFYEDRQKSNPDKTYKDYEIDISHMNQAGALFDMVKLSFISKEWLAKLDKETFAKRALERAKMYASQSPIVGTNLLLPDLMEKYPDYTFAALNIERLTDQDPKRYTMWSDVALQLPMFYDEVYETGTFPALPDCCSSERMKAFVYEYVGALNLSMTKEERFAQLKEIGNKHGFASSNAEFKAGGFVGRVGDVAMFLRIKLLCATNTPDLYETIKVMGVERVATRLKRD